MSQHALMEARNPAATVTSRAWELGPQAQPWLDHSLAMGAGTGDLLVSRILTFKVGGTAATPSSGCEGVKIV